MKVSISSRSGRITLSAIAALSLVAVMFFVQQSARQRVRAQDGRLTDPEQRFTRQDLGPLVVVPQRKVTQTNPTSGSIQSASHLIPIPEGEPVPSDSAAEEDGLQKPLIYANRPSPEILTVSARDPITDDPNVTPVSLGSPGERPWYFLQGYAGGTYSSGAGDQRGGGAHGLRAAVPIYRRLAFYAEGYMNHYSHGTTYAGTLGLIKTSSAFGSHRNRIGYSILFDQFTDTELGNPYLAQMRYAVEYGLTDNSQVGVRFTDGVAGGDVSLGGGAGTFFLQPFDSIGSYYRYTGNRGTAEFGVGYVDELDTILYQTVLSKPITDGISVNFQVAYEDVGLWTGFAGVAFDLSGRAFRRGCACAARASTAPGEDDIVRGASDATGRSSGGSGFEDSDLIVGSDEQQNILYAHNLFMAAQADYVIAIAQLKKLKEGFKPNQGGGCPANRPFRFCGPIDPNDCSCCADALGNDCITAP